MRRRALVGLVLALGPLAAASAADARAPVVGYEQEGTGQFRLYDAETGVDSAGPPLPTDLDYGFRRVTVSHNGRFVVYRRAGKVRLFDRGRGVELRIPALGNGSFVTVTDDGDRIAYDSGSNPPTFVYDRSDGDFLTNAQVGFATNAMGENIFRQPVFSGDGRFLVGTEEGCAAAGGSDTCLYELGVGKVTMPELAGDDEDPCIDGDGSLLAVTAPTAQNQPHDVFELDLGANDTAFATPPAVATAAGDERFCFIDPSGRYLAYREDTNGVESLYDRQTGTFLPLPGDIEKLAGLSDPFVPAPAGPRKPVVAYLDNPSGAVKLFDSHTGRQLPDPGVTVPGMFKRWSISFGGRYLVWVEQDADPAIHLVDRQTGSERALPGIDAFTSGPADRPGSLTVSDTGLIGFDRNGQGPTRIYDLAAGAFFDTGLDPMNGHTRPSLSGDGRFLATNCNSGLSACEVELDDNDNAFLQDLTTKTDAGFPQDLTGSTGQDQQRPCIDGDGSRVAMHAIPPPPASVQKDVYLYDRGAAALVPLPPGVNDPAANDANCRLETSGQYLGLADEGSGAFRLYSLFDDGFVLLPPDAANPLADVWLSSPFTPQPPPGGGGDDGGGAGAPPAPGGGDRNPPRLRLAGRRSQRLGRRGVLAIIASCNEACALSASGTVATSGPARAFRLRRSRRTLRRPGRTVLRLRLSKTRLRAVRRALARGGKARARIRVTARDVAGNSASARRVIRVRR